MARVNASPSLPLMDMVPFESTVISRPVLSALYSTVPSGLAPRKAIRGSESFGLINGVNIGIVVDATLRRAIKRLKNIVIPAVALKCHRRSQEHFRHLVARAGISL